MLKEFSVDAEKLTEGVRGKVLKQGFNYPSDNMIENLPEDQKQFPTTISDMTVDELLDKLAIFTALYASASVKEAKYMVEVAALERDLEFNKAAAAQASKAAKVTEKRQEVLINENVVKIMEKLTVAEAYLRMYSVLRTNYEKFCFLCSRALTVKGEEHRLQ